MKISYDEKLNRIVLNGDDVILITSTDKPAINIDNSIGTLYDKYDIVLSIENFTVKEFPFNGLLFKKEFTLNDKFNIIKYVLFKI